MKRWIGFLFLALPIAGLAGLWWQADDQSRRGVDWDIPIAGNDPRDLLRGHYIQFRYDWPGMDEEEVDFFEGACLIGSPPQIERVIPLSQQPDCEHVLLADFSSVHGRNDLRRGRLYVDQTLAGELESQLFDQESTAIVKGRLRSDGRLIPQDISFVPVVVEEEQPTSPPIIISED